MNLWGEGDPLIRRHDHIPHQRVDLAGPFLAAEYAVVADAGLQVVAFAVGEDVLAQGVGGHGLADRADVVALALDREQHGLADRGWIDALGPGGGKDVNSGERTGGRLAFTACSKPYASLSSTGSLQAGPKNEMPTGRPRTKPAGTLICG